MKPSETQHGQEWLTAFRDFDQEAAVLLIDSLEIHDHVEIMNSLSEQLYAIPRRSSDAQPVVLVPIRSTEDLAPSSGVAKAEHIAYQTFDPGAAYDALPGSEADVGAMFRGLIEKSPGEFLPPGTSLEEQRVVRTRTLCLVTDYCGSGTQALRFVQTFRANPTIASWISYGKTRLRVVSYAANLEASRRFANDPHVDFESRVVAKSAHSSGWSTEQQEAIEHICHAYAVDEGEGSPLGYRDSFGLYLTNMRAPNNLPQILIRAGGPFPGLFPGRVVPSSFAAELRSYHPPRTLSRILRNMGSGALAARLEAQTRPISALSALAALQLLDFGISEDQVWALIDLEAEKLLELKTSLIALGLITIDFELTKLGRAELHRSANLGVQPKKYIHSPRTPVVYEPTQLR